MKSGAETSKKTKKLPRQYTLLDLQSSITEQLTGPYAHLRPPSIPTLKNLSRSGALKKITTLEEAVRHVFKYMLDKEAFYTRSQNGPLPVAGLSAVGAQLSPQIADRILSELQGLVQRISNIENKIVMETRFREATIDPRLTQALDQLDATRKHVLNRLDAELQGIKPGGGRGFDGATAVDAARILAIVSQIKDVVLRWDSGPAAA